MRAKHFLAILLGTLMTWSFVWVRLQIVKTSYEINELNKHELSLRDECNKLHVAWNEARSPQKLEQIATKQLEMVPPQPHQVIVLSDAP